MKPTHKFTELTARKSGHKTRMDGTGLRFETMEQGICRYNAAGDQTNRR
jgi:hypothetical protein